MALTAEGLTVKTQEEILDEIESDQRVSMNPSIDQSSASPLGQLNGIFSNKLAEVTELLSAVFNMLNRSGAEGAALDNVGELTGTERNGAEPTQVFNVNVNVNDLFTQAPGAMVASVEGLPNQRFFNSELVSNTSGGPVDILVQFAAEETGPTPVNDQTLTTIAETLPGWNSVTNRQSPHADDSTTLLGENTQSDTDYRQSQREELTAQGGATEPAIDARLEALVGMVSVTVFHNDGDFTDAIGLPPHSIEALVYDGPVPDVSDDLIAQTLFDVKGAGVQTFGGTGPIIAQTSEGEDFPVFFTRPTLREVWIEADVVLSVDAPADVLTQVETAIGATGTATSVPGADVIALTLKCAAQEITGVLDVPSLRLGFAASPTGESNLVMGPRELATFSTARILAADVTP